MTPGTALRAHRLLMRIALSAGNAFAWIFVFEYFYLASNDLVFALVRIALLYALAQTIACLLAPFTARGLRRGLRREIVYGVLMAAAAFVFLGAIFEGLFGPISTLAIIGFAVFLGLYRALYWIPYEVDRHDLQSRPSPFSFDLLIALLPAFVGYMITLRGLHEAWLLFASGTILALSLLPLIWIPEAYEGFPWGYRQTFGELFTRAHRILLLGALFDGMQGVALLLLWPIAIFLALGWSYPLFGMVFSLTFLIVIIVREGIERYLRKSRFARSVPVRVAVISSAWVGRLLAVNPISIVVINSYTHLGDPRISTDDAAFEQASDAGHFVDEFTTLREIGLSLGRIAMCCAVVILAALAPLPYIFGGAFVIAGMASGGSVIVSHFARSSL